MRAGRVAPGLVLRPAVARCDQTQVEQAAVRHGPRTGADIVGQLRANQDDDRRVAERFERSAVFAAGHAGWCRRRQEVRVAMWEAKVGTSQARAARKQAKVETQISQISQIKARIRNKKYALRSDPQISVNMNKHLCLNL